MRVTDEMVQTALDAIREHEMRVFGEIKTKTNGARYECMRVALSAALSHAAGQDGEQCRAASGFELLELAAIFESCVPFLPPVGQRNITKAVAELRALSRGVPEGKA